MGDVSYIVPEISLLLPHFRVTMALLGVVASGGMSIGQGMLLPLNL
jgi:hypothetical protein